MPKKKNLVGDDEELKPVELPEEEEKAVGADDEMDFSEDESEEEEGEEEEGEEF